MAKTALKKLRERCGLAQEDFAQLAGARLSTLQKQEIGARSLSKAAANRIAAATGCKPGSLFSKEPLTLEGKPYTAQTFQEWKTTARRAYLAAMREKLKNYVLELRYVLSSSLTTGRLETVFDFDEWLTEHRQSVTNRSKK